MKRKVLCSVMILALLICGCGNSGSDTEGTTVMEKDNVMSESVETEETETMEEDNGESESVVEVVEPDYYFDEEFALSLGDTVKLEEGILFSLKTLDYLEETENYRVDYIMSKDDTFYPGRFFMDKEGTTYPSIDVYNPYPITFVDVNESQAVFSVSNAPEIPAPMEISGNAEDVYTTDDFEYVAGDRCILYLDKGVSFHGNIMEDLENIMSAVEKESGFEFYVENKYSAIRTDGIREIYYEEDPWPGVDEFNEKIAVYVVNRPERHLVSCAFERAIVIVADDFDIQTEGIYAFAHELCHTINFRNGEQLNRKLTEGFACYMGARVAKSLTQYPTSDEMEESYYGTFPEKLNHSTAEELFLKEYNDYAYDFKEYQYGMYFVTYLYETYGDRAFRDLLQAVNEKNDENYTLPTNEIQVEALKECFSENIFAEFGDWYNINKDRFACK